MIDWHRPSIYERLRCFGLCRFTMGVASHNVENPPAAVASPVCHLAAGGAPQNLSLISSATRDSIRWNNRLSLFRESTRATVSVFVRINAPAKNG